MYRGPKGESGNIVVWGAIGLAVCLAFAGLATDVPYLYVARQQAQTAADAGALSGAYGLFVSPSQAVADGKVIAGKTPIIGQLLTPGQIDVFTCNSNNGGISECLASSPNPDQVTCITHRDKTHGNPMPLFVLPVLQLFGLGRATSAASGWDVANVSAAATARLFNSCGSNCFVPWSIADRWTDVDRDGKFKAPPDRYIPPGPGMTGYQFPQDNGLQVTLKVGSPGDTIVSGFFYGVDFPPLNRGRPVTGSSNYRNNISTCVEGNFVQVGDQLQVETGNMVGPTRDGARELINQDPTAFWDTSCQCVNSPFGTDSPRLARVAFFDPRPPVTPGRNFVTVVNVGGFFIERLAPTGDVIGRFTRVQGLGGTPNNACSFFQTVQLVK